MSWLSNWWQNQKDFRRLSAIKAAVDARIDYYNFKDNVWQYVPIMPLGHSVLGDCQTYTETYRIDCQNAGYHAERFEFMLPGNIAHCRCIVTTPTAVWALDNMERVPVKS